ncbi:Pentatricopeptide repeat-containing protein At3g20730 [Linum grandiflorum]
MLELCIVRGAKMQGLLAHARWIIDGSVLKPNISTKLIAFYSRLGDFETAHKVFDRVPDKDVVAWTAQISRIDDARYLFDTMLEKDVVSWNAMVGGYAVQGLADDSYRLFHGMMVEGLPPDHFTLGNLLKVSGRTNNFLKVSQLHGFVEKLGFGLLLDLVGSIIDAYARCGRLESASFLYNCMTKKDKTSCTALMNGFAQNSLYRTHAMNLFKEVHREQCIEIDDVMLCSVINMCANATSLVMGTQLHAFAFKSKPGYDVAVGNSLVDMYAKSGEIKDARRAFGEMEEKNVISWTSLISGCGTHGYGREAVELCKEMEEQGLIPNGVTFLSAIFACSHSGLDREGSELFDSMINKHKISPRAEHISCMVDLFARAGQLEDAYDMICKNNLTSDSSLWGAILGACSLYGNVVLGETVATRLISLNPDESVNYAVLGNIYATSGAWHDSCKIRNLMSERKLKKTPGCSSIDSPRNIKGLSNVKEEVYGALDSFVAWDLEFPLITVKKALRTLEFQQEWKRIIQVSKWMLNKGQGRTMGTYFTLLNALAEEQRLEEAEELWNKLFMKYLEGMPRKFFDKMMSIYYKRDMHDKMFEIFADMEELGVQPSASIVNMVGTVFQHRGMLDKYEKLKRKYPPPKWEIKYIKGKRVRIKAKQYREYDREWRGEGEGYSSSDEIDEERGATMNNDDNASDNKIDEERGANMDDDDADQLDENNDEEDAEDQAPARISNELDKTDTIV